MSADIKALAKSFKRVIEQAENNAGTLAAKDSVKLVPAHWHAVIDVGRQAADALASAIAERDEARAERDFEAKIAKMLLDWAVSHGAEPDLLVTEWIHEKHLREAAEARIEELTRERDEARRGRTPHKWFYEAIRQVTEMGEKLEAVEAERVNLAARLEEAKAVLGQIEALAGNLPDERLETASGPNDARMRGGIVVTARALARAFLHQGGSDAR